MGISCSAPKTRAFAGAVVIESSASNVSNVSHSRRWAWRFPVTRPGHKPSFTIRPNCGRWQPTKVPPARAREEFDTLDGPWRCAHAQKNPRIASTVLTATAHWIITRRTSREINARRRCRSLLNLQYALANGSGAPLKAREPLGGVAHEDRGVGRPAGRIRLEVRFMNAIPAHDARAVETQKTMRFLAVLRSAGPTSTSRDDNGHR